MDCQVSESFLRSHFYIPGRKNERFKINITLVNKHLVYFTDLKGIQSGFISVGLTKTNKSINVAEDKDHLNSGISI